ncbi:MAG: glycosyltransferase family 39 protein [Cyanobacteria bacterium P01_D01_bin.156]
MDAIAALFPVVEVTVLCLGFFVWLRRHAKPYSVSVSLALGITSGLTLVSLLFQIGFLIQRPDSIPVLEGVALAAILWVNRKNWSAVSDIPKALKSIWAAYPRILTVLAIALTYLWLQAVLLPPGSWDALVYHLPRVLLWEQNRSLFLQDFVTPHQAVFPVGADILFHIFLRSQTDYGLGLFSWLSYLVILFGTYGLVRPRVSRSIALTSALVISCLPEIIYQSTETKNDIIIAAVALACVLWGDRWLRIGTVEALVGLGVTLCFGVSAKTTFVLFAAFFLLGWLSLVIRQGKFSLLMRSIVNEWRALALCICPGIILSQCWLFAYNYQQFGSWLGPEKFILKNQNTDGLLGGIANLVRYTFQSIHLLEPVEILLQSSMGWSIVNTLQTVYDSLFDPLLGNAGQAAFIKWQPLEITWLSLEGTSWFGPVSLFLVFPSIIWCLISGRKLSRLMAIVALCLVLATSYKVGWSPWKSRFFTMPIVCTGICVATALRQFRIKEWGLSAWRWLSISILIYACLYNCVKPVLALSEDFSYGAITHNNIWLYSDWTRDRQTYERLYNGDQTDSMHPFLSDAKRVAIIGYGHYFSIMFKNPDVQFVPLQTEDTHTDIHPLEEAADQLADVDYLICYQRPCAQTLKTAKLELLWESKDTQKPHLYRVQPT